MEIYCGDFSECQADEVDQSLAKAISVALAAKASGDNEYARRSAREALRQVQRSKHHPDRPFFLSLAKALNAYCFGREDRARLLLKRIVDEQGRGQTKANEALAFALATSCQIV